MRALVVAVLFGVGALAIAGIGHQFTPAAHEQVRHDRVMNRIAEERAQQWQNDWQPAMNLVLFASGALVLVGGAAVLVGLGAAGTLAAYHSAQGVQFERRYQLAQLAAQRDVLIAEHQYRHALPMHSLHYAPAPRITISGSASEVLPEAEQVLALPDSLDLLTLNHSPSTRNILLGVEAGNKPVTVSSEQMVHVALAGATGSGKTNTSRLLLAQLLACGVRCVVANPHYTSYDAAADEDWRPITARLHMQPARSVQDIGALLHWLVKEELERRLELRAQEKTPGMPIVLFLDELPVIAQEVADAVPMLSKLLRQGRALRLYAVGASQDFLVKTLGGGSGVRDCYRTAVYSGGDVVSAASLLDMGRKDIQAVEGELGGGVVLLRSTATTPARLVRVPYVSNEALYRLLPDTSQQSSSVQSGTVQPRATTTPGIRDTATPAVCMPDSGQMFAEDTPAYEAAPRAKPASVEAERALALLISGKSTTEIVLELRGIRSNQGSRYRQAADDIHELLRAALAARGLSPALAEREVSA